MCVFSLVPRASPRVRHTSCATPLPPVHAACRTEPGPTVPSFEGTCPETISRTYPPYARPAPWRLRASPASPAAATPSATRPWAALRGFPRASSAPAGPTAAHPPFQLLQPAARPQLGSTSRHLPPQPAASSPPPPRPVPPPAAPSVPQPRRAQASPSRSPPLPRCPPPPAHAPSAQPSAPPPQPPAPPFTSAP